MAYVNVNRNLEDQFYRYKMPRILAKVEGKGNGIKTVIVNMVDVAKALNRPPMYPTKYFGCVLGAQVNCDAKNERYIVNGAHDSLKLQELLDGFIKKYVLCNGCSNPETVLTCLVKKGIITTSCKACGYSGTINSKDKLTTFILKNPPNSIGGESGTVSKKDKRDKKNKGKEDKNDKKANGESGNGANHDDSDEFKDAGFSNGNGDAAVDDDWCEDTTADAVKTRMNELTDGAKGLMLNDDLEKSSSDRHQLFFDFVQAKKAHFESGFDVNTQKEVMVEAERLDIRDKAVLVLCELLFNEKILHQIKTHRYLFLRFCADNPKSQKYLLRGFELTVKEYRQALMPKVSHILKAFYDADILDEKVLLDWGSKVYKKTVGKETAEEIHEKAAPFLKWLKEAEEEDSDEDEEEEEIEVVYDDRHRGNGIQQVVEKEAPNAVKKQEEPAADDIDIDAI